MLLTKEGLKKFIENISFSGLLSLYAFSLAYSSKKGFTFEALEKKVDLLPNKYCMAFFIVAQSLGLLKYSVNKNSQEHIYNVLDYDSESATLIKEIVLKVAKDTDARAQGKLKTPSISSWVDRVKNVEDFFT